ncbi:hypothetical protein FRB97_005218 [Tulasnella sp. 331]|nr:hypothetical protein FRB97_005218 [Tulasnella sp. 331]
MRLVNLISGAIVVVTSFGGVSSTLLNDQPAPSRVPKLQDLVITWYQRDHSELLHLIRAKAVQDPETLNILEAYEQSFTSRTHEMIYRPPYIGGHIRDAFKSKGRNNAGIVSTIKSFRSLRSQEMRKEIEDWWANENRIAPLWLIWAVMFKPE